MSKQFFLISPCRFLFSLSLKWKELNKKLYNNFILLKFPHIGKGVYIEPLKQLEGTKYMHIGSGVTILSDTILTAFDSYLDQKFKPQLIIEDNVIINPFNHITCINKVQIGAGTLTGKFVTITDNAHGETASAQLSLTPPIPPSLL